MKKSVFAAGAVVAVLMIGGRAHAQGVPVYDNASVLQQIQAVLTATQQLAQLQAQLTQMQNMNSMFKAPTNVSGMFPQLNTGFAQNSMPMSSQMPMQIGGMSGAMSGPAQTFYNQNHVYTATGTDPMATALNRSGASIANIQGMAATNLAGLEQRLGTLKAMQSQLQGATDIKQVTAINGRIAIEQHAVQAQQAQAQNLQTMATAQIAAQQQAQQEMVRKGWEQALAQWRAGAAN